MLQRYLQGWTLASAHSPMVGNFHGGQVKFDDKYQPGWQVLFFPKVKQIPDGQIKDNFELVTFQKLPARLASARKR